MNLAKEYNSVANKNDDEVTKFVQGCTTVIVGLFNLGVQITLLVFMIKHW
jgi:hypothetical protein